MFGRLMPREGRFFDLFNEHAELVVQGSRELAALMASGDDLERRAHNVESIEKRADRITRSTTDQFAAKPGSRSMSAMIEYSAASPWRIRLCSPWTSTGTSPANVTRCTLRA